MSGLSAVHMTLEIGWEGRDLVVHENWYADVWGDYSAPCEECLFGVRLFGLYFEVSIGW